MRTLARSATGPGIRLWGRRTESDALDGLVEDALAGTSGAVVIRGEPGVGKTALLDYLVTRASGCRIARAAGVESEMELPFSGLHQLCAPFLNRLDRLPAPQGDALGKAFGLQTGDAPDRFLVGLAVLTLLADVAETQPLVCVVDDAHWLDRASTQALGVVARRLAAESVVIAFGRRESIEIPELAGLAELSIAPLGDDDARALLASAMPGRLDESVRDRIVAEAGGNPLALLELPRAWTPAAFAGGFALPDGVSVSSRIEESFRRRLATLPHQTRQLLLVAAADPTGSAALVWAAAARLGIRDASASPAIAAGLLDLEPHLRFRHPLVRSVVYRESSDVDRRLVHAVLADATDHELDPDRRAWHRAHAAPGPDEEVATELEQSATRALRRGGLAAAAAFLRRAVTLTREPARRTDRALAAAQASLHAGAFDAALTLLGEAEAGPLDELQRGRAELLRGEIAFASSVGSDAPPLLLKAARRLERIDADLARETYLDAWGAALFAGQLATSGDLVEVSRAAMSAPRSSSARSSDLLLNALAVLVTSGRSAASPLLRQATDAFAASESAVEGNFRWGWLTTVPSNVLWDEASWHAINIRQVNFARAAGALARLPIDLTAFAVLAAWCGDFGAANAAITEADAVTHATATQIAPYAAMLLAAFRGREDETVPLLDAAIAGSKAGGQGIGVQYAHWVAAILWNSLGRYDLALAAAQRASDEAPELFLSAWALPELVEASARTGDAGRAADALERLTQATAPADTDWARAIEARCRALVSHGPVAEGYYREAIDRFDRTRLRLELARAQLLYGEWLRRENRRVDAREQLRAAHETFSSIGAEAFAERARGELMATGETVRKRSVEAVEELTPQEVQIARLASDGRTNAEIGAQLFLSPRTVEWHLRKVFAKLGVASRRELHGALPGAIRTAVAV